VRRKDGFGVGVVIVGCAADDKEEEEEEEEEDDDDVDEGLILQTPSGNILISVNL
jgi:hypothetical protein